MKLAMNDEARVLRSAGVSPAVFSVSSTGNNAGGTPALQSRSSHQFPWPHSNFFPAYPQVSFNSTGQEAFFVIDAGANQRSCLLQKNKN
jgi:hypothetical protein